MGYSYLARRNPAMAIRYVILVCVLGLTLLGGRGDPPGGLLHADEPAKQSREEIDKLIAQLKSDTFKVREEAMRQLMERDDALPALRTAAKSDDVEVVRRAQQAIDAINKRLAKRAIRRAIALLKKGQTDQFVEQVVPWRDYVDEECWKAAVDHVKAIADEASKVSGGRFKLPKSVPRNKYTLPWVDITKLPFVACAQRKAVYHINDERIIAGSIVAGAHIHRSFLICTGAVESKFTLRWVTVFANGNLSIGNGENLGSIDDSIVVCDGNVTATAAVINSTILCTGNVKVGARVQDSVIVSGGDVKIGFAFPDATAKNSVIQDHQSDPLKLIHFFEPAQVGIEVKSTKEGVRVEALAAAKSFAQAGVRQGDRVVAVDGVKIDSAETFRHLLRRRMQESNPILLETRRKDKLMRFEVRVTGDAP
jgi:hypothetical protein